MKKLAIDCALLLAPEIAARPRRVLRSLGLASYDVGPLLALMWRSRRYLAGATAVKLTRSPDAVARGLAALASREGTMPGGSWAAPLFVVGPKRVRPEGSAETMSAS